MEDILYEKEFKCPVCNMSFKSMKIKMSKLQLEKRNTDLRSVYKDINPFYYSILVCPFCGFSANEKNMESLKPAQRKRVKDYMLNKWVKREYSGIRDIDIAITTNLLALTTATIAQFPPYEISSIALTLARLFEEKGNEEEKIRFLTTSRDFLIQVYMEGEESMPEGLHEYTLCYLIGELSRELGDKKNASTYMGLALKDEEIRHDAGMSDLVREQWHLIKEME